MGRQEEGFVPLFAAHLSGAGTAYLPAAPSVRKAGGDEKIPFTLRRYAPRRGCGFTKLVKC